MKVDLLTQAEAVESCPSPKHEWRALEAVFGPELLAQRLGVSPVSVRGPRPLFPAGSPDPQSVSR